MQLNSHKNYRWQAELSVISQKGDNAITQAIEYIFYLHTFVIVSCFF